MLDRIEDNPPPEGARTRSRVALVGVAACGLASLALPALAYIGPGAGFALLGSFMVILVTIVAAFLAILVWPIRKLWRLLRRKKRDRPWARRLIVVGLDGQEPKLTDRFMAEGKLPNFKKLADQGCYHRLRTTFPSVSPVAWSSFSTGTHPAKHNIYDFLDRDRRTYLPLLSSTEIGKVERFLHLGRFRLPLHRPELRLLRKSKPFWTILGEYHVWSTVLRVPITFPPDRFYGAELSAMCAPDLLGTQGTFLLFTTRSESHRFKEGGMRIHLAKDGVPASSNLFSTRIEGPPNMFLAGEPPLTVPLQFELDRAAQKVRVQAGEERVELEPGKLSDWVSLTFPAAPLIKVSGICRMQVTELGEHFSLYVTPISFDPENPAMPISHPSYYATYLAKKIGPFNTLGLAEDTWALNEGVVDDGTFLAQTWSIDAERRAMFFAALERLREGTLSCVFDATDRIQHMFWRYLEADHPAAAAAGPTPQHQDAIADLYRKNDELVGQVLNSHEHRGHRQVVRDKRPFPRAQAQGGLLRHQRNGAQLELLLLHGLALPHQQQHKSSYVARKVEGVVHASLAESEASAAAGCWCPLRRSDNIR